MKRPRTDDPNLPPAPAASLRPSLPAAPSAPVAAVPAGNRDVRNYLNSRRERQVQALGSTVEVKGLGESSAGDLQRERQMRDAKAREERFGSKPQGQEPDRKKDELAGLSQGRTGGGERGGGPGSGGTALISPPAAHLQDTRQDPRSSGAAGAAPRTLNHPPTLSSRDRDRAPASAPASAPVAAPPAAAHPLPRSGSGQGLKTSFPPPSLPAQPPRSTDAPALPPPDHRSRHHQGSHDRGREDPQAAEVSSAKRSRQAAPHDERQQQPMVYSSAAGATAATAGARSLPQPVPQPPRGAEARRPLPPPPQLQQQGSRERVQVQAQALPPPPVQREGAAPQAQSGVKRAREDLPPPPSSKHPGGGGDVSRGANGQGRGNNQRR